jgi:hypothetical protein
MRDLPAPSISKTRQGGPQRRADDRVRDHGLVLVPVRGGPRPDGLAWPDVVAALPTAVFSNRAVGLQAAIYSPDIDTDAR